MNGGRIVTFYSYKGGVGRSFALANIGATLAQWGYRVLCVDWDLEAPGLDQYFAQWIEPTSRGLIDIVEACSQGRDPRWSSVVSPVRIEGLRGTLGVVTAGGRAARNYATRVQDIDWNRLYEKKAFGAFLERLREQWKATYDFVLIDSRTGISDVAGITSIHLPDLLAVVVTPNAQSLSGVARVAAAAMQGRDQLPYLRAGLMVLPIVSRFELRVEYKVATEWLGRIESELGFLYRPWLPRSATVADILKFTRIPHVPYWSFGESLPAVIDRERADDAESVNYVIDNLAALIVNELADAHELVLGRDTYVGRSAKATSERAGATKQDLVYVSASARNAQVAERLVLELRKAGLAAEDASSMVKPGHVWKDAVFDVLGRANVLVVLLDGAESTYQRTEIQTFVSLSLRQRGFNAILPVICNDEALDRLPAVLSDLTFLDARAVPMSQLAQRVRAHVTRLRQQSSGLRGPKLST